jgi:NifB/MoaA-like Fe-S oxidoreductase
MVCGKLIAPILDGIAREVSRGTGAVNISLVDVENAFFGPTVTVSGLLTAEDVLRALRGRDLGDLLVLPRVMFDAGGEVTLDGCSLADLAKAANVKVVTADRFSTLERL